MIMRLNYDDLLDNDNILIKYLKMYDKILILNSYSYQVANKQYIDETKHTRRKIN